MKADTVYTILQLFIKYTGVFMTSGRVGLKFLLNNAHKHIIDLCEHIPSWSGFEYAAAIITPVAFQEISDIYSFSSVDTSRFYRVVVSLDSRLKKNG